MFRKNTLLRQRSRHGLMSTLSSRVVRRTCRFTRWSDNVAVWLYICIYIYIINGVLTHRFGRKNAKIRIYFFFMLKLPYNSYGFHYSFFRVSLKMFLTYCFFFQMATPFFFYHEIVFRSIFCKFWRIEIVITINVIHLILCVLFYFIFFSRTL